MSNVDQGADAVKPTGSWMGDVQRALAILIIGCLVVATTALIIRLVISAQIDDVVDVAKIMLAALVNMGLIALGFFFGSSKSKEAADAGQQQLVDKLTSTPPGTLPPAPGAAAATPWWTKLTDAEKSALTADDAGDARTKAIVTAMTTGAATPDDLDYLVSKGLLTKERADEIAAS